MKKIGIIVAAMALVLGLSQCKKEQPTTTNGNDAVAITLEIQNNGGTRMDVNTGTGEVTYETGDMIYVGSDGKFIGTLTHNGTNFAGTITNPTVGEPLHFYFLGNVTPAETLTAGTTTTCSVVISDQTEHLPVISYAPSRENYQIGKTNYNATLLNKCALVKFDVTTSSEAATCLLSMNNKVNIYFINNSFSYSKDGEGMIAMAAGSGEKWAILLPQPSLIPFFRICNSEGVNMSICNAGKNGIRLPWYDSPTTQLCRAVALRQLRCLWIIPFKSRAFRFFSE